MPFEERFAMLCERAKRDFDEYLWDVAVMDAPEFFKEAKKIVVMEEMLSQIKSGQFDHPLDVELLLYHDHPLLAAYNQWEQDGLGITAAVNEGVNVFLAKTRNQLVKTQAQYDTLSPDEQARIMEYKNRKIAVFDYLQVREESLAELMERLDRDYADCQIYTENCTNLDGEYPADFANAIEAIYQRMKTYGYTDEQLAAANRLSNPLSSAYFAYKEIIPHGSLDEETIDRAITLTTGTDRAAARDNSAEEAQGQDDGLDR